MCSAKFKEEAEEERHPFIAYFLSKRPVNICISVGVCIVDNNLRLNSFGSVERFNLTTAGGAHYRIGRNCCTAMFTNKTEDGLNNFCGKRIARKRKEINISQRELADRLQLIGLDVDKNAIQRIECGKRFVTDIEIRAFSKILDLSYEDLLSD